MFALLAMAGDLGGSIGPGIIGRVTQYSCRYGSWAIVPGYFINHAFYFCKAKISFNKVYGGYDG